jgi:aminodeoxyfutalosine synthase
MDLSDIAEKLAQGTRLTAADGIRLFTSPDVLAVGQLAHQACRQRHGRQVSYIINRHLNPTNICRLRCPICAFSRAPGDADAFCFSVDDLIAQAEADASPSLAEFHVVGGLHPTLPFSYALDLVRGLRARFPGVAVKAFTAVEIDHWAAQGDTTVEGCLSALRDAGLSGLTGGGAEIFAPRVRAMICPHKLSADRWLAIHGCAHALDLPSTATMLYGHVETVEERVDHLLRLRAQQDRSGGFTAFVPLPYHPAHTALGGRRTSGRDDLLTVAVSRLLLDNIPHIKAYWVMLGVKIAQLALPFGANDLDGTVVEERICHMAGGQSPQILAEETLQRLIREAGGIPVRRDSRHRLLATTLGEGTG